MPKYDYKALKDIDRKIERGLERHNLHTTNAVADSIIGKLKFHFETPSTSDIATLWQGMIGSPDLRKFFLTKYSKQTKQKDSFSQLFCSNALLSLLGEIHLQSCRLDNASYPAQKKEVKKQLDMCYNSYMMAINNGKIEQYV